MAGVVREVAGELGHTPAQVAPAWTPRKPGVASTLLGARTPAQLEDNLGALAVELTDAQLARLDAAGAITLGQPHELLTTGPSAG
ncbi:aldo/keto reductase [Streptomyces sp. NPDC001407]|uniref:aldo/keto reductase n=1 Tax=Streptomyces sp. NPDC001407 TaxID=3364573 RepID=UPI0036AACFC4